MMAFGELPVVDDRPGFESCADPGLGLLIIVRNDLQLTTTGSPQLPGHIQLLLYG